MLFRWGRFKSAAGIDLDWKIECDALHDGDLACIARVSAASIGSFRAVHGVPRGGLRLAESLDPYKDRSASTVLVVDDVWTTGRSMTEFAKQLGVSDWVGFVAFARGDLPPNVKCFAKING